MYKYTTLPKFVLKASADTICTRMVLYVYHPKVQL